MKWISVDWFLPSRQTLLDGKDYFQKSEFQLHLNQNDYLIIREGSKEEERSFYNFLGVIIRTGWLFHSIFIISFISIRFFL